MVIGESTHVVRNICEVAQMGAFALCSLAGMAVSTLVTVIISRGTILTTRVNISCAGTFIVRQWVKGSAIGRSSTSASASAGPSIGAGAEPASVTVAEARVDDSISSSEARAAGIGAEDTTISAGAVSLAAEEITAGVKAVGLGKMFFSATEKVYGPESS